ncbi:hypothetical protein [Neoroseomonas soli]|uniref:Lipoprotein n=1 Tax=Neoroseomonas soli TaxID=1081025 RepID=A0A9X9X0H3_9PROT|nr:hypothetical protein [Neoroseomonas soli]MBR0672902.1 hypothetical protein [Neoroseomonas soli]
MINKFTPILVAAAISGCSSSTSNHADQLARVPIIIAALKCAFATALMEERNSPIARINGAVASGTLSLKIVHGDGESIGARAVASAGGPFVFPYAGSTGSILPSFSSGVQRTDTIQTSLDFRFLMVADDARVCDQLDESQRARLGLSEWLASVIRQANVNVGYDPPGQLDRIRFNQDFAVSNVTKGGLDFNFVFLNLTSSVSRERNDIQNLTFTIGEETRDNPAPLLSPERRRRLQRGN